MVSTTRQRNDIRTGAQPWIRAGVASTAVLAGVAYGVGLGAGLSPVYLFAAPLVAIVIGLAIIRPELAALALLALTWGYLSEIAVRFHGIPSPSKSLTALLMAGLIIRRVMKPKTAFVSDATTWWMCSFLLVIMLGTLYAANPDQTLLLTIDFGKDLLLFLVLINLITSARTFEQAIWALLAVGALLGAVTLFQELTQTHNNNYGGLARASIDAQIAEDVQNRPRAGGPTNEPLAFGQQLLVLVPLGFWGMLHARSLAAKLFAGSATALCAVGVGLSFSRSSYIALAVVIILWFFHVKLNPRFLLPIALLTWGLLAIAPSELTARLTTLEELLPGDPGVNSENQGFNSEASYKMRSVQLLVALNMFLDHPLLGVGGWNFTVHYPSYIEKSGSSIRDAFGPPHNYYLEVAADHGLLGLFVVGGILFMTFRRVREAKSLFLTHRNRSMADLAVALQTGLIGYLVSAAFLHGLYSRFLWIQVALGVALALISRREAVRHTRGSSASRCSQT